MAFIWNDEIVKFIDLDEDWDKTKFVFVRKLLVKINDSRLSADRTKEIREFTEEILYQRFSEYGPIENVEIREEEENHGKKYAYIQYRTNKDAYKAYLDEQKENDHGYVVLPADTWRQPEPLYPVETADDQDQAKYNELGMSQLNEDCLIEIFQLCDILSLVNLCETSRKINDLIHKHIFLKRQRLVVEIGNFVNDSHMTLGQMHRLLSTYGEYVTEVELCCDGLLCTFGQYVLDFEYSDDELSDWSVMTVRYLEIFSKHIGTNLKKLTITNCFLEKSHINALKPVFNQTELLRIEITSDSFDEKHEYINYTLLGPIAQESHKLKVLHIEADFLFEDNCVEVIRHATKLEELSANECTFEIHEELIDEIVSIRKELNITDMPLIFKLDVTNSNLPEIIDDPEIRKYLKLVNTRF